MEQATLNTAFHWGIVVALVLGLVLILATRSPFLAAIGVVATIVGLMSAIFAVRNFFEQHNV